METRMQTMHGAQRAVTLTELLVVLAIIGLLATIAVPVYLSKMHTARINTAQLECKEIAQAEEQCAIFHSFFVPIQILDDLSEEDAGAGVVRTPPADTFANESLADILLIDPFQTATAQAATGQFSLDDAEEVPRVYDLVFAWQGPFLNAQRVFKRPGSIPGATITNADVRRDFPVDPWGQPYRFFSPVGPIGTAAMTSNINAMFSDSFSDGWIRVDTLNDPFDRYAIVSFGPNQVLDGIGSDSDDIYYEFGMVFSTAFYGYYR